MRLCKTYERFGHFWLPSAASKKVPGTLTISDGGEILLDLNGTFEDERFSFGTPDSICRIVGELERDGYVTLDDCLYKNWKVSLGRSGIGKSSLRVHRALVGLAYDDGEQATFHEFSFSIEGLDEWLGISGIAVDYRHEIHEVTIAFARPSEIVLAVRAGFEIRIGFAFTLPGLPALKEAKISQRAYITLRSDHARPLSDFTDIAHKVTALLCLATDSTVCLSEITAASNDIRQDVGGESYPCPVKVFYPSLPFTHEVPDVSWHKMLFRYGHIKERAEEILNRWIDAWEVFGPALGLYFSSVTGRHKNLDSKFLSLAQGLESFHRRTNEDTVMDEVEFGPLVASLVETCPEHRRKWLRQRLAYANEVSLATRLKSIITPLADRIGGNKGRARLVRKIVDTRNYLTHFDQALEARAAKGAEMLRLCYAMELLFQVHLLRTIGFTVAEVEAVIDSSYRLKQKLALVAEDQSGGTRLPVSS